MSGNIATSESHLNKPGLRVRCVTGLEEVNRDDWDALDHGPSPFLRYGFLRALELSGSVGKGSGWHPFYLLAETDGTGNHSLVGAVAAFVKSHSYGEYIFDWSWASAAERAGLAYYPKLVITAPATPATGSRLLIAPGADHDHVSAALVAGVRALADEISCSSIHWLFCTAKEQARLAALGFAPRASFQFHWHNQGYRSYDDFLAALTSRKRKQLRKERQRALAAIDGPIDFVSGGELGHADIDAMDRYYRQTVHAHGGMDYLQPRFFHHLVELVPEQMLIARARRAGRMIAGAFFMETGQGLYGRYWGCDDDVELLHFETAYYAGIERCIARGIPLFEAGAQGEHKLLRGFLPSPTYSAHWLRHPGLFAAISDFCAREQPAVAARMAELETFGPYKSACEPGDASPAGEP